MYLMSNNSSVHIMLCNYCTSVYWVFSTWAAPEPFPNKLFETEPVFRPVPHSGLTPVISGPTMDTDPSSRSHLQILALFLFLFSAFGQLQLQFISSALQTPNLFCLQSHSHIQLQKFSSYVKLLTDFPLLNLPISCIPIKTTVLKNKSEHFFSNYLKLFTYFLI